MKISNLDVCCDMSHKQHLEIRCECYSVEDVEDLVAWLMLAKDMMAKWDEVRSRRAQASYPPKEAASEDENSERRKVQSGPRLAVGSDG